MFIYSSAIYNDLKVSDSWWHIVILLLPMPSLKYASLFLAEGFEWPDNYFSDTDTIDVNEDTNTQLFRERGVIIYNGAWEPFSFVWRYVLLDR